MVHSGDGLNQAFVASGELKFTEKASANATSGRAAQANLQVSKFVVGVIYVVSTLYLNTSQLSIVITHITGYTSFDQPFTPMLYVTPKLQNV